MAYGGQFVLLLWKNWLIQKRKPIATALEIFLPVLFAFILIIIRQFVYDEVYDQPTTWERFEVDNFRDDFIPYTVKAGLPSIFKWQLAYTPKNPTTDAIMNETAIRLNLCDLCYNWLAFDSESDMIASISRQNITSVDVLGGIVFNEGDFNADGSLAEKITYTVRMKAEQYFGRGTSLRIYSASDWYTSFLFPLYPPLGPRQVNESDGGVPGYYREGFLSIQRAVDMAIIHQHNATSEPGTIPISLQRYPYPPYIYDPYVLVLANDFPSIILLSFIVAAPNIVKDLVLEKERRLRETMKMMGLKLSLSWIAWFVKYFLFLLISVFIMTLLFCIDFGNGAIINYSDPTVIFMFLMLYAIATIMFCFMISAFFSKANAGAAAGGILFIVAYIPYSILQLPGRWESMTPGDKALASLLSNTAMPIGCLQLAGYEVTGVGLQWGNLNVPLNVDDKFTMAHTFAMFVIDSILYGIITWYIDSVMPRDYGLPLPVYFPFTKSYWCGSSPKSVEDISDDIDYKGKENFFEENPSNMNVGIKIRKLRKEFKRDGVVQAAVDDVSLDVFEGQITALLGHNGAGKTTTIFMLTGFLPPTSGTAYVNKYDIRTDIDGVRESLGLCPQHDVLFDTLTVEEHLEFFAKLKGYPSKLVKAEVDEMIQLLRLEDKRKTKSLALSGGMKRKLCVGIALIGKSETVILDEPTSGMDPEARRATWDILQSQRAGRTMILTTHFMEEADFLGDRIAIMANGVVQCCGSSLFLKNKYGVGYHMVMVKSPDCKTDQVTQLVQSYVPDACMESNISAELSYVLPSQHSDKFEGLFGNLEKNKESLGILSFGASVTTLEEVFIKVGEEIDSTLSDKLHHVDSEEGPVVHTNGTAFTDYEIIDGFASSSSNDLLDNEKKDVRNKNLMPAFGVEFERNTGFMLYLEQFYAMLIKRIIHTWRNKLITIVQLVVPVAFALIACIVMVTLPGPRDPPAIDFGLYQLRDSESPYDIVDESNGSNTVIPQLIKKHKIFLEPNTTVLQVDDMESYLAQRGEDDWGLYRQSMMTATTFNGSADSTSIMGWFNNEGFHSAPMEVNVITNTLLKYFTSDNHEIRTVNHPLPRATNNQLEEEINTSSAVAFLVSYYVYFGLCFVLSTFIVFLIKERSNRAKHIQFVSGVHMLNYWISTFAWDFINYMIPCFLLIIVFAAFDIEPYYKGDNAGYFILLYLGFGWAALPCMYLLSFVFNVPASGYVWSAVLNIFTGTVALIVVGIMSIPALGVADVAEVLDTVFYIVLPNYAFGVSMQDLYMNYETKKICGAVADNELGNVCDLLKVLNETNPCCPDNCGDSCIDITIDFVSWTSPGIGRGVTFMTLQGLVFFTCIFIAESGFARRMWNKAVSGTSAQVPVGDDEMSMEGNLLLDLDVKAEKERINQMNVEESEDILILKELGKIYNGHFVAVDGLSVGVPMGECFGLLGVNGAGKTTTFKMLTGDESITSGEAFVEKYSVANNIKEVQQKLGYCPQFDALIEQMTVKETLRMYARLRGVKEEYIFSIVDALIEQLLLQDHQDKQAGTLSGGNKRKLSTAIALVGEPPIVFLDEPTTGMDPVARRLLWDTLTKFRASGRTIVLTSHSMEECEALCTRIAIMVNGQFKCMGSTQHLKNKFGEGYTIMAKVKGGPDHEVETRTLALRTFIENTFPGCVLKDLHHGYVHYQINRTNLSWAKLFGTMERAKDQYEIEDYSVSQTTLEQVFLNFAKNQQPPKEVQTTCGSKTSNCITFCCCCGCCRNNATVPGTATTVSVNANGTHNAAFGASSSESTTNTIPEPVTKYEGGRLSTDL